MVDFHSPAVIEKDSCAYTPDMAPGPGQPIEVVFGSGGGKALACHGWNFHVSVHVPQSHPH